jgi:glycosyltransferase involved in cell wall biosynthesis
MKAKKEDLLSIIIVVKNDRGIAATIDAIHALDSNVAYEVIIIDSSEPSRLRDIKEAHPWVRWEQYPVSDKRTTPEQRNRGLELAKGNVIVFIDANCIPESKWLEAIAASLNRGEDIICGPVHDLSQNNLVHYAPEHEEGKYVDICTTINVAVRREVFDRIGDFDISFSFGQDVDLFWRASDAGYKIYYDPQVIIGHDWGLPKEQFRRAYDYGKARAHLYKKHLRTRSMDLVRESHVWLYPLYIIGSPIAFFFPAYLLFLFVPVLKNRSVNPVGTVLHHLTFGIGVIAGTLKSWPSPDGQQVLVPHVGKSR